MTEDSDPEATWKFRLAGSERIRVWSWQKDGPPDLGLIFPVRRPRSSARQKHIPVTAYSVTMGDHLELESGLEHDLLRRLDRLPHIQALVPQPCVLVGEGAARVRNVPDLLTV